MSALYTQVSAKPLAVFFCWRIVEANWKILNLPWRFIAVVFSTWILKVVSLKIKDVSDDNWTQTQNHLVRKWTLNHLTKLNGCGFESSFSHLNFRFHVCFKQGVPWHSGNYRLWIHSETRTWHGKNIQIKYVFGISTLLVKV